MLEEVLINLVSTSPLAGVLAYIAFKLWGWVREKDQENRDLQKEHSDYLKGLLAEYGAAIEAEDDDE